MKRFTILLIFIMGFSFAYCAQSEKEIKVEVKGDAGSGIGLVIKSLDDKNKEKLDVEEGALVIKAIPETSAAEAGLQENDVVIEANGQKIETALQLNDIAEALKVGDKLSLKVIRDGEEKSFTTEVQEMKHGAYAFTMSDEDGHHAFAFSELGDIDHDVHINAFPHDGAKGFMWHSAGSDKKGGYMGVELDNVNDQMKEYFEVDNGALIKKVNEDSPAEKAGLKAGDIITKINDKKIEDVSDVVRTVNYYDPEDEVTVYFVRKGDSESADVVLGKKKLMRVKEKDHMIFISEDDAGEMKGQKRKQIKIKKEIDDDGRMIIKTTTDIQIYII